MAKIEDKKEEVNMKKVEDKINMKKVEDKKAAEELYEDDDHDDIDAEELYEDDDHIDYDEPWLTLTCDCDEACEACLNAYLKQLEEYHQEKERKKKE